MESILTPTDKKIISKGYEFCMYDRITFKKKVNDNIIYITRDEYSFHKPLVYSVNIRSDSHKVLRILHYTFGQEDIEDTIQMIEEEILRFLNLVKKNNKIFFQA